MCLPLQWAALDYHRLPRADQLIQHAISDSALSESYCCAWDHQQLAQQGLRPASWQWQSWSAQREAAQQVQGPTGTAGRARAAKAMFHCMHLKGLSAAGPTGTADHLLLILTAGHGRPQQSVGNGS